MLSRQWADGSSEQEPPPPRLMLPCFRGPDGDSLAGYETRTCVWLSCPFAAALPRTTGST